MTTMIKIVGTDPISKSVLVKCNTYTSIKPIDAYSAIAYPPDFKGAYDRDSFMEAIKESCRDTAFKQDHDDAIVLQADTWVGHQVSYIPTVPDTTKQDFDTGKSALFASYPPANMDSIRTLLATTYPNMQLAPLVRFVDATVIGVYVNGYGGKTVQEGAVALSSINRCTQDCIALGVPMCGGTTPLEGSLTRAQFESYLSTISIYNRFIGTPTEGYVYQDWVLDLAKNRKLTIIKSERNNAEAAGFPYMGHQFDSDERSVQRITAAALAANVAVQMGAPFAIDWTAKDNVVVPMTAADVIGMPVALAQNAGALHVAATARKALVNAATTFAEVDAA